MWSYISYVYVSAYRVFYIIINSENGYQKSPPPARQAERQIYRRTILRWPTAGFQDECAHLE